MEPDYQDIQANKVVAALAYVVFFIPMLVARESRFAMYHANQGLVLFLGALVVNFVGTLIPIIGWFIIVPIGNLLILVLAIIGIINAIQGLAKPLPLIGSIQLFNKW
ncbi:hypothetical protein EDM56_18095 [Brevibacillus fluminis]|uniref:DUF4870 domain-containing protein n=1 Tax=Brevibacillus fluminis TaxID=511487 RepID=A0A3M8DCW3_9BACL|nr:hypothetical protein [Brevibacillus fluminis]RNB85912.1 hypothetical protein EDM56_18095 [Brevibacillus fluminis]